MIIFVYKINEVNQYINHIQELPFNQRFKLHCDLSLIADMRNEYNRLAHSFFSVGEITWVTSYLNTILTKVEIKFKAAIEDENQ